MPSDPTAVPLRATALEGAPCAFDLPDPATVARLALRRGLWAGLAVPTFWAWPDRSLHLPSRSPARDIAASMALASRAANARLGVEVPIDAEYGIPRPEALSALAHAGGPTVDAWLAAWEDAAAALRRQDVACIDAVWLCARAERRGMLYSGLAFAALTAGAAWLLATADQGAMRGPWAVVALLGLWGAAWAARLRLDRLPRPRAHLRGGDGREDEGHAASR